MIDYNTQRKRLPMPEYGRSIQNMVDYALTIQNRAERQQCAETIIRIMGNMFPQLRDVADFKHKLWDHLAVMADFKLDIDFPYEIQKVEMLNEKPQPLQYHSQRIRYRHYGALLEKLLHKLCELPEGAERDQLTRMVANQMKRSMAMWNPNSLDDHKILQDLMNYTHGVIKADESILTTGTVLSGGRSNNQQRNNRNNNGRNNRNGRGGNNNNNNKNNRKKY